MIGTFAAFAVMQVFGFNHPYTGIALVGVLVLCIAAAMLASGGAAVVLEFVAYRPLRRRGASRLAALICAIGASLFLQELFATVVVPRVFGKGGRDFIGVPRIMNKDDPVQHRLGPGAQRQTADLRRRRGDDDPPGQIRERHQAGPRHPGHRPGSGDRHPAGREHQPGRRRDVPRRRDHGRRGRLLLGPVLRGHQVQIGFILGIKAFTAAVLGGIGNLRGRADRRVHPRARGELRIRPSSAPNGTTSSPSRSWSSSFFSVPPASSVSLSSRPAHERHHEPTGQAPAGRRGR